MTEDICKQLQGEQERIERFLSIDPQNVELLTQLARIKHRLGEYQPAAQLLEQVLSLHPGNSVALNALGQVYLSQHQFKQAAEIFAQALEQHPRDAALHHNRGIACFYIDNWPDAAKHFQAAQEIDPTLASNSRYLALSLHHLGNIQQAITAANRMLEAKPSSDNKGYVALLYHDHGDKQQAIALAQETLRDDPDNADARVIMGDQALEYLEMQTAIDNFSQVIEHAPENGRAWLGLGLTWLHSQQFERAVQALQRARTLLPTHNGTTVALGWSHLIGKDYQAAEAVFRSALEEDPNFAESHGGLACALAMQKRTDEAKKHVKTARRLDPKNFGGIYASAILKAQAGNQEAGIALINSALEHPMDANVPSLSHYLTRTCRTQQARDIPKKSKQERHD